MVERPLRILQVSTVDFKGGAEKVAWNLFTAYRARGYDSWLAVGEKLSDDTDVLMIPHQESRSTWNGFCRGVSTRLRRIERRLGMQSTLSRLTDSLSEPGRWLDHQLGI